MIFRSIIFLVTCLPILITSSAIKIVLLGPSGAGKTCFAERWIRGRPLLPTPDHLPTIGAAFFKKTIPVDHKRTISVDLWDTAGQERFGSLMPMYVRGAHLVLVVYDVGEDRSYSAAMKMMETHEEHFKESTIFILVGCKRDTLEDDSLPIISNCDEYADSDWAKRGFIKSYAVSSFAKDDGFETMVSDLIELIKEKYQDLVKNGNSYPSPALHLTNPGHARGGRKKSDCC